jgi:hypothetical protein
MGMVFKKAKQMREKERKEKLLKTSLFIMTLKCQLVYSCGHQ